MRPWTVLLIFVVLCGTASAAVTPVCSTTANTSTILLTNGQTEKYYSVFDVQITAVAGDKILVEASFEVTSQLSYPPAIVRFLSYGSSAPLTVTTTSPLPLRVGAMNTSEPSGDDLPTSTSYSKRDTLIGWHVPSISSVQWFSLVIYANSMFAASGDYISVPTGYGHICVTNFGQ